MKMAGLTNEELLMLLADNGYAVISNDFWESHDRIIIHKDGTTFPLQFQSYYNFPFVVRLCESLEIEPPEDCKKSFEQFNAMKEAAKKPNDR